MSTRFDIRKAVSGDASAACALLRRSIALGCKADHQDQPAVLEAWLGNKTPANVASWFANPSNHALVAERVADGMDNEAANSAGELLGLCLLTQAGKVALCYVTPETLRSGVGRALLAAAEEQARAWDITKLHLHSPASASAFFERQGYINAGKDTPCFGLECDLLWKPLDPACQAGTSAETGAAARKRFCNCSA